MFEWVTAVVESLGYVGLALMTFGENIFPPIPSEVVMPLGGFLSARGSRITFFGAVAAGTAGAVAGATGWYWVGRRIGEERLRAWIGRNGRWLTLDQADVDRASGWFERHGGAAVFFGRLVPGIRTFISLPAGFARQPLPAFLAFTVAGTTLWTAALVYAGRLLGRNYERVDAYLGPATWVVFGAIIGAYLYRVIRGYGRGSRAERAS